MDIRLKRVYDAPSREDGFRVLVDRLWPRGLTKEAARIDLWLRDIAPSDELRKSFAHDPARWEDFIREYRLELRTPERRAALDRLRELSGRGPLTLVFAAKDAGRNNAVVLARVLEEGA